MANEGMGMAGGFAEAAGGVMSGFQYARQQQALEQQRKQQELQDAENRADSKMKRELLMKEIANKEKAREIYAMDPVKDFGLDAKSFPNRDLYEAELSKQYAAQFRKFGLGEEAVKHESVGGQFYEQGVKKAAKSAFAKALSGRVGEAQTDLEKIGFNVGEIKQVKGKDGSMSFEIYDEVEGKTGKQLLSTLNAAELAGVMGDEDAMIDYLMKKDTEISKVHAELEAKVKLEEQLKAKNLGQYAQQTAGVDPAAKEMLDKALSEAAIFRTKDGTAVIVGEDLKVTKGLFESGHNLASVNKMRQKRGLPEIEIKSMNKDQFESLSRQYSGLTNEEMSSDKDIELGADWYGRISPKQEGKALKANGMNSPTPTPTPTADAAKVPPTPMGGATPTAKRDATKNEPSIYDENGLTKEESARSVDLQSRIAKIGGFTGSDAMNQMQKAKKELNELENLGQSRKNKKGTPAKDFSRLEIT